MNKKASLSFDDAFASALELADTSASTEWVFLLDALGRTVCCDIVCSKNLPSYNNAAMDGYAFKWVEREKPLRLKKRILAGECIEACLESYECYKIMTGAKIPEDADTIIPFEESVVDDDFNVHIPLHVKKGNAFRHKGEEHSVGEILLLKGEVLTSAKIALLASQGMSHVEVYAKIKVAVISTGDELKKPWEKASEDEIYDVNAFSLIALLKEQGFDASYAGVVADNLESATQFFAHLSTYDVIVSSGGVSMGEADFVEKALIANGFVPSFHGINIKPGKPTMMGKMGHTIIASMPGNPLAAYVNAFVFLVPLLRKLQGQINFNFNYEVVKNKTFLKVKSGRVNFILGKVEQGIFEAYDNNNYGSGMIKPLVNSTSILISDEKKEIFEAGEEIKVLTFQPFFSLERAMLKN